MSDSRSGIETMLYLLDEAFRGVGIEESNESQALLPNLRSVPDSDWHRLPEGAAGEFVQAEYFRDGAETLFGLDGLVDGGFAMGQNLPLFALGEIGGDEGGTVVTTSDGERKIIPKKADFGTVSSGGLY